MTPFIRGLILKTFSLVSEDVRGKIVFYHDVHKGSPRTSMSTPISLFLSHVETARMNGFDFTQSVPSANRTLQVCFDDGFAGLWDCREEVLKAGVKPTVYVAVDLIGRENYLNREQILELQRLGFVFQSHTWTHRSLTDIPHAEIDHELVDSRKWLMDFLQREVNQLCFPRGLFSRRIIEKVLEAGYDQAVSSIPGSINPSGMLQILPRNLVQFYSPNEYAAVIKGGLNPLRTRYERMHVKEGV